MIASCGWVHPVRRMGSEQTSQLGVEERTYRKRLGLGCGQPNQACADHDGRNLLSPGQGDPAGPAVATKKSTKTGRKQDVRGNRPSVAGASRPAFIGEQPGRYQNKPEVGSHPVWNLVKIGSPSCRHVKRGSKIEKWRQPRASVQSQGRTREGKNSAEKQGTRGKGQING